MLTVILAQSLLFDQKYAPKNQSKNENKYFRGARYKQINEIIGIWREEGKLIENFNLKMKGSRLCLGTTEYHKYDFVFFFLRKCDFKAVTSKHRFYI